MHLRLDISQMRACMDLWRDALALPAHEGHREQQVLLGRVTGTVAGWSDLLRLCQADPGQEAALRELSAEVQQFKGWIDEAALATTLARQVKHLEEPWRPKKRISRH